MPIIYSEKKRKRLEWWFDVVMAGLKLSYKCLLTAFAVTGFSAILLLLLPHTKLLLPLMTIFYVGIWSHVACIAMFVVLSFALVALVFVDTLEDNP